MYSWPLLPRTLMATRSNPNFILNAGTSEGIARAPMSSKLGQLLPARTFPDASKRQLFRCVFWLSCPIYSDEAAGPSRPSASTAEVPETHAVSARLFSDCDGACFG